MVDMDIQESRLESYISVSEAALYYGKSTQQIYNMIRDNVIHAVKFNRGSMSGWLVEKPSDYNTRITVKND